LDKCLGWVFSLLFRMHPLFFRQSLQDHSHPFRHAITASCGEESVTFPTESRLPAVLFPPLCSVRRGYRPLNFWDLSVKFFFYAVTLFQSRRNPLFILLIAFSISPRRTLTTSLEFFFLAFPGVLLFFFFRMCPAPCEGFSVIAYARLNSNFFRKECRFVLDGDE